MRLYEVAYGGVTHRNIIVNAAELRNYQKQAIDNNMELYRSMYHYDDKIIEHFNIRKKIKGYIGICGLEKIIFDIDNHDGTLSDDALLDKVRYFVKELIEEWKLPEESVHPWYTGRGYHISAPNFFSFEPSTKLPVIVKTTISNYFPDLDYSIYDNCSLIRVGNTINAKVRRYKIPLTLHELYHLQAIDIIKLSEENRRLVIEPYDDNEVTKYPEKIKYPSPQITGKKEDNLTNKITCMQVAYNNGPVEGQRHQIMLRMGSAWRRGGMPRQAVIQSLQSWSPSMDKYEIEKLVSNIFEANGNDGYNFSCTDVLMKKFCNEKCVFFKDKNYLPETKSNKSMENDFANFIRSDYQTKSIDLMKLLKVPNKHHIIIPGENVLMFGDGGIGKTALAQMLAIEASPLKVLYGNFEFVTNLLYRRFVQIKHSMSKEQVMHHYMFNDNSLSAGLEHITIVDNRIDLKGLYQAIETIEPQLVILDTLMKINTADKMEYNKSVTLSNAFKKIAKDYNTIVLAINHIPKANSVNKKGDPIALNQHSSKGSGDLENMSDHVLMVEGRSDNDNRKISAGKARDEAKFSLPFTYDWNTFTYKYIGSEA
jgi:hypothetical protein